MLDVIIGGVVSAGGNHTVNTTALMVKLLFKSNILNTTLYCQLAMLLLGYVAVVVVTVFDHKNIFVPAISGQYVVQFHLYRYIWSLVVSIQLHHTLSL